MSRYIISCFIVSVMLFCPAQAMNKPLGGSGVNQEELQDIVEIVQDTFNTPNDNSTEVRIPIDDKMIEEILNQDPEIENIANSIGKQNCIAKTKQCFLAVYQKYPRLIESGITLLGISIFSLFMYVVLFSAGPCPGNAISCFKNDGKEYCWQNLCFFQRNPFNLSH